MSKHKMINGKLLQMNKSYSQLKNKQIYEACGESERAAYGKQLLNFLEDKLTAEFGKGFKAANLRNMRQFYLTFQNRNALRSELSWTHYRSLMRVEDEAARNFYLEETAKCGWSSRQLDRQINSFYYQRILASKVLYEPYVYMNFSGGQPLFYSIPA